MGGEGPREGKQPASSHSATKRQTLSQSPDFQVGPDPLIPRPSCRFQGTNKTPEDLSLPISSPARDQFGRAGGRQEPSPSWWKWDCKGLRLCRDLLGPPKQAGPQAEPGLGFMPPPARPGYKIRSCLAAD
jgi:hypothetical protein